MLLCKDLSWISEASSHVTLQGRCGLGVLAGIDVLGHSLSQCGNFRAQKKKQKTPKTTKKEKKEEKKRRKKRGKKGFPERERDRERQRERENLQRQNHFCCKK